MIYDIGLELLRMGTWIFVAGTFLLTPIVGLITVWYFDNASGLKNMKNTFIDTFTFPIIAPRWFCKAMWYGGFVAMHGLSKKAVRNTDKIYRNVDFNKQARLIDKIVCYPFFVLTYGGASLIAISTILLGLVKITSWL
jgi:hypothetical protein